MKLFAKCDPGEKPQGYVNWSLKWWRLVFLIPFPRRDKYTLLYIRKLPNWIKHKRWRSHKCWDHWIPFDVILCPSYYERSWLSD